MTKISHQKTGLWVEIETDASVFVIRDANGQRIASIVRRPAYATGPTWHLYRLDGREVGNGYSGVHSALRALAPIYRADYAAYSVAV